MTESLLEFDFGENISFDTTRRPQLKMQENKPEFPFLLPTNELSALRIQTQLITNRDSTIKKNSN